MKKLFKILLIVSLTSGCTKTLLDPTALALKGKLKQTIELNGGTSKTVITYGYDAASTVNSIQTSNLQGTTVIYSKLQNFSKNTKGVVVKEIDQVNNNGVTEQYSRVYSYDETNLIYKVDEIHPSTNKKFIEQFSYALDDQNVNRIVSFDRVQIIQLQDTLFAISPLKHYTYQWKNGNLIGVTITDSVTGTQNTAYQYDQTMINPLFSIYQTDLNIPTSEPQTITKYVPISTTILPQNVVQNFNNISVLFQLSQQIQYVFSNNQWQKFDEIDYKYF